MDYTHRQAIPVPEPPPAPAPPTAAPQEEATGDSESVGTPVSSVLLTGDHPSSVLTDEGDAESCSGGGNGVCGGGATGATGDGDSDGYYVAVEGEEAEVDSWMAVPWWRRTAVVEDAAARDAGGRCAPAAEGGAVASAGGHADESNRLFWEACIAHGY